MDRLSCQYLIIVCMLTLLTSCASPYQPNRLGGGFSDTQLSPDVFRIYFRGNAFTSMQRAQDFALLRAAELSLQNGCSYFAVVNESSSTSHVSFTTPGHTETTGSGLIYGNNISYTGRTTYYPGQIYNFYKPNTGLLIRCFAQKPENIFTFDAAFMERSLGRKYGIEKFSSVSTAQTAIMYEEKQEQDKEKPIKLASAPLPHQEAAKNEHDLSKSTSKPELLASREIVCNLAIFNMGKDRSLIVKGGNVGKSDPLGESTSEILVGGKEYRAEDIFLSSGNSDHEILFASHTAVQAILRFGRIARFGSRPSKLELRLYSHDYGNFTVDFQDVQLSHTSKSFVDVKHGDLLFRLKGCKPYKSYEVFSN
jgi:hypothetical protein